MGRTVGRIRHASPFANQRPALVSLLDGNDLAAQWLESMVAIYARTPKGRLSALHAELRTSIAGQQKELRHLEHATRRLSGLTSQLQTRMNRIAEDSAAFRSLAYAIELKSLVATPRDFLGHITEMLDAFATAAAWAQRDIAGPANRPGARENVERRLLENLAAEALARAGVALTKGREQPLAKVLRLVYEAAGMDSPEDLFPVLDRLVRQSQNGGLIHSAT